MDLYTLTSASSDSTESVGAGRSSSLVCRVRYCTYLTYLPYLLRSGKLVRELEPTSSRSPVGLLLQMSSVT